ncbi:hypothetical protein P691DRAFT_465195 [Macrolepiota fuliginosa MF-IS2]|uniref:Uncharacterized protein n=1 Tax=Macrolepiota fuliginosa MF-IS2 TaxID=1400762 RepID=A0A9P6C398_9AGAR|nr:hypothetical protein P691DRAFT_465195 [Macrolepiota fuliginosa MF-IS2]
MDGMELMRRLDANGNDMSKFCDSITLLGRQTIGQALGYDDSCKLSQDTAFVVEVSCRVAEGQESKNSAETHVPWKHFWGASGTLFKKIDLCGSPAWVLNLDDPSFEHIRRSFNLHHALIRQEYLMAMPAIGDWISEGRITSYVSDPENGDTELEGGDVDETTEHTLHVKSLERFQSSDELEEWMLDSLKLGLRSSNPQNIALGGHPGIGKTILLYLVFILRARHRLPTILLQREDQALVCYGEIPFKANLIDMYERQRLISQLPKHTWVLVDVDTTQRTSGPTSRTLDLRMPTLVSTPLHEVHLKWMSKFPNTRRYVLDVWSEEEILQGLELSTYKYKPLPGDMAMLCRTFPPAPQMLYSPTVMTG